MLTLRKRAIFIIASATFVASAVAAYRAAGPRQYEAVVTILVSASKLGANPDAVPVATANILPVLQNPAIVLETLAATGLSSPPSAMSVGAFLRDSLRVNPLGGTSLVEMRVRLGSAELAARAANALAEHGVALARRLSDNEATTARDQLKAQLDDAKGRYTVLAAALEALKRSSMVELLRKDAESILKEQAALRPLELEVAAARATVARAEQELSKRQRVDVVTRAIDADAALLEAVRSSAGGRALELKLRAEEISRVYETLDADIAGGRAKLAGLEDHLARARVEVGPAGQARLARLYQSERELAAAELEFQIAQKAYELAANQYENARLQVSSRVQTVQILSPAVPPEQPLSRQIVINAIMVFVLAAAAAAGLALFLEQRAAGRRAARG
jgi:uncharacterized protein involved in exopolysaccharide biosynthesis